MEQEQANNQLSWFNSDTDCYAIIYLPSGVRATYILAAYRITQGVVECIPRKQEDGSICTTKSILIGTIEIRNGHGLSHNVELFPEIEREIAEKIEYDKSWREVKP